IIHPSLQRKLRFEIQPAWLRPILPQHWRERHVRFQIPLIRINRKRVGVNLPLKPGNHHQGFVRLYPAHGDLRAGDHRRPRKDQQKRHHGNASDSRFSAPPSPRRNTTACLLSIRSNSWMSVQLSFFSYSISSFSSTSSWLFWDFSISSVL